MKGKQGLISYSTNKRFPIICILYLAFGLLFSACSQGLQSSPDDGVAPYLPDQTSTVVPSITSTVPPSPTPNPSIAFPCIPSQVGEQGEVVEEVDGDTIRVQINNAIYPIRYIGIDTPEISFSIEPLGKEAKEVNQRLVDGKSAFLYKDHNNSDQFGRLLRYVIVDGKLINNELVVLGVAEAKDYPPDTSCSVLFRQSQNYAMAQSQGLWANRFSEDNLARGFKNNKTSSDPVDIQILAVDKKAEVVTIINNGQSTINLRGWVLLSVKGGQRCSLSGLLIPGKPLQIWTASGVGFSCGQPSPMWSNSSPDPEVLLNASGLEVARFSS